QIAAWSAAPRGTTLFDTLIVFENHPVDAFEQHYARAEPLTPPTHQASAFRVQSVAASERVSYPLAILANAAQELTLRILYDRRHIDDARSDSLLRSLMATIRSLVAQMEAPLASVTLLDPVERRDVLETWNATVVQWTEPSSLPAALAAQCTRTPDAIAVVSDE